MPDEKKPGWVSGRVRESADGLSRRQPANAQDEQRMREAAEKAKAPERKDGDDGDH